MTKIIEFEFSPNGILGRVFHAGDTVPTGQHILWPDKTIIIYPGVFLGLPFDVHMPRGVPVFGPDVPPDTAYRYEHGKMEATLPDSPPARDTHLSAGGMFLSLPSPQPDDPQPDPQPDNPQPTQPGHPGLIRLYEDPECNH